MSLQPPNASQKKQKKEKMKKKTLEPGVEGRPGVWVEKRCLERSRPKNGEVGDSNVVQGNDKKIQSKINMRHNTIIRFLSIYNLYAFVDLYRLFYVQSQPVTKVRIN